MAIVLPQQYRSHFRQYLSLEECDPRDLQAWKDQFMWTMKKVGWGAGQPGWAVPSEVVK